MSHPLTQSWHQHQEPFERPHVEYAATWNVSWVWTPRDLKDRGLDWLSDLARVTIEAWIET